MKRLFIFVLALFVLFNLALAGTAFYGWKQFHAPGPLDQETVLVLDKGVGLRGIATRLKEAGIIRNDLVFVFGVRLKDQAKNLKAGEYRFTEGMSGLAIMNLLVSGKGVVHSLTIPEGLQSREIRDLIEQADPLSGELTEALPEGSILPETYHFTRGDQRNALVKRMKSAMKDALETVWNGRKPDPLITSKQDLLVLASIVEKETGLASERPHVAGVFLNRLKIGMRLQSDPTVIYGVTEGKADMGRPISRKDLATDTPYNTYTRGGLPAGPISNPGLDSLRAVVDPKVTKDLYFVADGTGGHAFARTLAEHNRNVRAWRKLERAGGSQ
ncbi:endolytic transglycosylase MltG [Sneathiella chinensis]|uniref:Endolytic murein transglycosylase n=1 Tax=Sneathiella chinensis TaxID=349750 RepID=A0ABQ5U5Z4_9PROT|nr:endolytic transglycosylase MltG [Sneathiella chinensis]GLQ07575.1 aminodeoxychorismate lyase [Sneathiella chinensis]